MLTCNLMGGLGNQLFQIFTVIAYAIKSQNIFKFYNVEKLGFGSTTIRYTYWNTFLKALTPFLTKDFPTMDIIREKSFHYSDISHISLVNRNTCLHGYFQSYKYFDTYFYTICRILKIDEMKQSIKVVNDKELLNNCISMHFRLGDYKKVQHMHPILKWDYYEKALHYIQGLSNPNGDAPNVVLYFCEQADAKEVETMIHEYTMTHNTTSPIQFKRANPDLQDWEQMLLMSCCRCNIIANSTFSWWGAHLNNTPNKIVCYPSQWFGPTIQHDTSDLFPLDWVKISI